jgi:rhamnosyl/mannosyltransferase
MRVCHLGKYYPPAFGGIETHVRTLAQAQAAMGLDVQVVCFNHQPGPTQSEQDGMVRVVRVQELGTVARLAVSPGLVAQLRAIDADLLHMQVPNPSMILAWLAAKPRLPMVVTYQSDHVKQRVRRVLFRPLEHRFYRQVARILATSPTYAGGSSLLQEYADRVDVVPMGIDLDPYLTPTRAVRDQADSIRRQFKAPLWFACGRLIYYKGFEVAIRALSHVEGSLLIAGNGPDLQALQRVAAAAGVRERVHFLGVLRHQDIVPYYLAAHASWFPSIARSEAFGLVQVEAMACGRPVINTSIPHSGVAWVSPHGESGLTVPVGDERALAAAAQRLLDDPALHARLAAGARARAQREFTHVRMAERVMAAYQQVLSGRQVASAGV